MDRSGRHPDSISLISALHKAGYGRVVAVLADRVFVLALNNDSRHVESANVRSDRADDSRKSPVEAP
jgi:hypothetical protein